MKFTTSTVRCSPTKLVSGFVRPPPTPPPPGGNHRALQLPTFPLSLGPAGTAVVRTARLGSRWPRMNGPRRRLLRGSAIARDFLLSDRGLRLRDHFWTVPKSRQLPKPEASSLGRADTAHQPRGLRPAPPRLRFPSPSRLGFRRAGPGASGCNEGTRPCGTSPAPPGAQPDFLQRRAPGTPDQSPGRQSDVRDRPRAERVAPFPESSRQPCHGVQPICYLRWGLVALSDSLLPSRVSSLQPQ